ncbi:hypothetical protein FIM10_18540 [Sphingomonadales bacterium 56]|uniref:Uncharacterized protein n=2 Tax=Sphingobium TaxID=165695 RepID=A0A1L5BRN3_SPHIB|nr:MULTISPECIES: hypothetical protein [Sphingobium]MBY2930681.1 hypothetical protein [Sphingomonadales bacterium 56]MBY2960777.1 hypothetical protein [Sphingomonadales bacterium 58]CAD7341924.1 hypothetical protein SPHS8_03759 [Sphingobium sp. S8]APL95519.1 hypothetical protein SIDU_13915 [Sphingobium indicum B90A]CAD7341745.1 hypothetical protein SPHS6_03731 [Sphingobium sp. S6]
MKWWRCELIDQTEAVKLTLDVLLDASDHVVAPFRYYGEWESLDSAETYPLVFLRDGHAVDLGEGWKPDRYNHMELHGARLLAGDEILYYDSPTPKGEPWVFIVRETIDLVERARRAATSGGA